MKKFVWLALPWLLSCSDAPIDAVTDFKLETPRPFGYVIGDELTARIVFEARPGLALNKASLPAEGPINRWLNLNHLNVRQDGQRYRIDLTYQVFYAPQAVKTLTVPGFELRFGNGADAFARPIPPWQLTMSPLRALAVKDEAGLRPDSLPPQVDTQPAVRAVAAGFGLSSAAGLSLGWLYGLFPAWRRSVFKQALKHLARCSERDMADALRILHQALNRLNRKPLFQHQLAGFYRRHPAYRGIDDQLHWFFNYSNHYFFSRNVSATALDFEKLIALCTACRHIERGSR